MTSRPLLLVIALAAFACAADAQVYKCKGADGKTTYSGTPCAGAAETIPAYRLGGNTVAPPAGSQPPAASAERGGQSARTAQQDADCRPDDAAVRDIQVRLTSQIYSGADRRVLREEGARLTGCEFSSFTPEERSARLHALQQLGRGGGSAVSRSISSELDALYDRHRSETQKQRAAVDRQTKALDRTRRATENAGNGQVNGVGGGAIDASGKLLSERRQWRDRPTYGQVLPKLGTRDVHLPLRGDCDGVSVSPLGEDHAGRPLERV